MPQDAAQTHLGPTRLTVAVLGADALLAVAPATPVQLMHACLAAGFDGVYPASWGDELTAAGCLDEMLRRGPDNVVFCACPLVRAWTEHGGHDLDPYLLRLASPPVTAARYVRALYAEREIEITYIGGCPGAEDAAIDARMQPATLLREFAKRSISVAAQPKVFESILPPDRRRFYSLPGGLPSPERLHELPVVRRTVEIQEDEPTIALAEALVAGSNAILNASPRLGCLCAGATPGRAPGSARDAVTHLEPPRAQNEVVDTSLCIDVAPSPPQPPAVSPPPEATEPAARSPQEPTPAPSDPETAPERTDQPELRAPTAFLDPWGGDQLQRWPELDSSLEYAAPSSAHTADREVGITYGHEDRRTEDGIGEHIVLGETFVWEERLVAEPAAAMEHEHASGAHPTLSAEPPAPRDEDRGTRHRYTPAHARRISSSPPVMRTPHGSVLPRAYAAQRRIVTCDAAVALENDGEVRPGVEHEPNRNVEAPMAPVATDAPDTEVPLERSTEQGPPLHPRAGARTTGVADTRSSNRSDPEPPAETAAAADTAAAEIAAAAADRPPSADIDVLTAVSEETDVSRLSSGPVSGPMRSVVVPLPTDRPRLVPPPSGAKPVWFWIIIGAALVALAVLLLRFLLVDGVFVSSGPARQRLVADTVVGSLAATTSSGVLSEDTTSAAGADSTAAAHRLPTPPPSVPPSALAAGERGGGGGGGDRVPRMSGLDRPAVPDSAARVAQRSAAGVADRARHPLLHPGAARTDTAPATTRVGSPPLSARSARPPPASLRDTLQRLLDTRGARTEDLAARVRRLDSIARAMDSLHGPVP